MNLLSKPKCLVYCKMCECAYLCIRHKQSSLQSQLLVSMNWLMQDSAFSVGIGHHIKCLYYYYLY